MGAMTLAEISRRTQAAFTSIEQRNALPEKVSSADKIPLKIAMQRLENSGAVSEALGLIPVFRALQIITTAAGQLTIEQHRGQRVITGKAAAKFLTRPDPASTRTQWIQEAVLSLATDGNLFLRVVRDKAGAIAAVRVLPPREVTISEDPKTGRVVYWYKGEVQAEILHQKFMPVPGQLRGLGPIQAARQEIIGALDVRDYATGWFSSTGQPSGLLTSPGFDTAEKSKAALAAWNMAAQDPNNPSKIRVLGGDIKYTPLLLNPEDAQWLDARKFTVTDIARLFGIPSALMLVSLDGNSLTYSNVEQEWVAFTRFTLIEYLRKIEDALSDLAPMGAKARFNLEALLRGDTAARYAAYALGISSGFITPDEAREKEGLDPLTPGDIEQIQALRKKSNNDR